MIDGDVLRGVEIRRGLRGMRASAVGEVQMPAAPIDAPDDFDPLAEGLRELWDAGGFSTKNVAFGVNGRDATIRPMTVPRAAADDVAGYVRYQLADYLSYELDDAVIDHQVVDEPEDGAIEVLAIGVPAILVERLGDSVAAAGLTLASVDAAPTALATTIDPASPDDEGDAVVSVDGTRTTVVLRSGGRPRMVRVLAGGGGDRTAQLADELEGMIARVEGHQQGGMAAPVLGGQDRRFAEAADAVAAAINYDLREHTGTGVDHVVVTGAFGRYESLHHLMATAAGTSVAAAMAPSWWPQDEAGDFDDFDHFVEPAGLAYSHLDGRDDSFDLMPPTVREANADRRELTIGVGLAAVVAAGSLFAVLPYRADAHDAQDEATALEADVGLLSTRVDSLALVGELDQARLNQIDSIAAALRDDLWWGRILDSIADATGEDTYLTSMTLVRPIGNDTDQAVVAFNGVSADQAAVGVWLDRMDDLGIFADIWLVQSTSAVLGESQDAAVVFLAQARLTSDARGPRSVDPTTWVVGDDPTPDQTTMEATS
ncbi:MAG: PilN domain-containing protein [Actinomycetota bacterium]